MQIIFSVAIGGAIGAILRFLLSRFIGSTFSTVFPLGTFVVNISGSFLIGFFYSIFDKIIATFEIRAFLLIGIIGAFTTFSTFVLETFNLLRQSEIKYAVLNFVLSNFLGLLFVFIGFTLTKIIFRD
jgi:CrcB protein